jgi:probable rRNA maturation factor
MPSAPELLLANLHPGQTDFPLARLEGDLRRALGGIIASPGADAPVLLGDCGEVEISLVDDPTIDRIHREFMGIEGATDVITFQHGEILVSLDTTARQAKEFGHSAYREALVCAIHGLLHLHGYDDTTPEARERMHARQEALAEMVCGE